MIAFGSQVSDAARASCVDGGRRGYIGVCGQRLCCIERGDGRVQRARTQRSYPPSVGVSRVGGCGALSPYLPPLVRIHLDADDGVHSGKVCSRLHNHAHRRLEVEDMRRIEIVGVVNEIRYGVVR